MKRHLVLILICILCFACSRQQSVIDNYSGDTFYYTDNYGELYEFSGTVSKINAGSIESLGISEGNNIQTSTKSSVNVLSPSGSIIFRHESTDIIYSSTINKNSTKVYYVTKAGDLKLYDRELNNVSSLGVKVYPLPKQMILDEQRNIIYYHNKRLIYRLDLNTKELTNLSEKHIPIQSIALNKATNEIYFSSSVDGKIYKISNYNQQIFVVYHPMSATGSSICFDSSNKKLYFSRSNGRDVQIYSLNMLNNIAEEEIVLYNINYISNLVIKN